MKIVVASGKGGTGKTTVATNLAVSWKTDLQLLDCDVEEPDCHLFLKPTITGSEIVGIPVPKVDESRCRPCGQCGEICQYGAIVSLGAKPVLFPELCHGCGGCALVCPVEAISEVTRPMGVVEHGHCESIGFVQGRLSVGEAMSPPVIRAVKEHLRPGGDAIIDAPPGTSCPVVEAARDTDFAVLVTEPTPFGLHDLVLAVELMRAMALPCGVVINRAGSGDGQVERYCQDQDIPILLQIPFDRSIAEACSRGELLHAALPRYRPLFTELADTIARRVDA